MTDRDGSMRFRVLGPVQIGGAAGWARVERPRRRALLGYLLLAVNRSVPVRELSTAVWGAAPPSTARSQLQNDVVALRKALTAIGPAAAIHTRTGGYELVAHPDLVDERLFHSHLSRGAAAAARGAWSGVVRPVRDALALWSGPALADVAAPYADPARDRLERQRADAVELLAEARIRLGRHDEQIDVLRELVDDHPERDRAAALLMLALVRAGSRADALAVARELRRRLRDAHGLDPAWLVTELERRILREDPLTDGLPSQDDEPAVRPAAAAPVTLPVNQLPMDVSVLAGRDGQLGALAELAAGTDGPRIALVSGTAGVGKTALAVRFGHRHAAGFPGGVLFVDLRGYDPHGAPLPSLAALHRLLVGLGVPRAQLPSDVDDAAALFRSRTSAGGYLVVLDNAGSAAQVRALLPGGVACFVVVTSRDSLPGLLASHAVARVALPVLTAHEGLGVLARVVGHARVDAEPAAAESLVELCGGLPLAVRIVAANLADTPGQALAAQADLLRAQRLSALDNPGDQDAGVRSVLRSTHAALQASAQRVFRLLSVLPYGDVEVAAIASFASAADVDRLRAVHLVEESAPGRLTLHDLPRAYGAELSAAHDDPAGQATVAAGVLDWFARRLDAASALLYPESLRLLAGALGPAVPGGPAFADAPAARAWVAAERANLLRSVGFARESGLDAAAWRLAASLRGYLMGSGAWLDLAAVSAAGLAAATACDTVFGRALHLLGIADAQRRLGDHPAAITSYAEAVRLARDAGWLECQAVALGHLGIVYSRMGDIPSALDCFEQDFTISGAVGWRGAQAVALGNMGNCAHHLGRPAEAMDYYERAAEIARETGATRILATSSLNAGCSARDVGDVTAARAHLERAAALFEELGRQDDRMHAYAELSLTAAEESDLDEARRWHRLAAEAADRLGSEPVDPVIVLRRAVAEAALLTAEGRHEAALAVLSTAEARSRAVDLAYQQADVLLWQGVALSRLERPGEARERFGAALALARARGFHRLEERAAAALAVLPA